MPRSKWLPVGRRYAGRSARIGKDYLIVWFAVAFVRMVRKERLGCFKGWIPSMSSCTPTEDCIEA